MRSFVMARVVPSGCLTEVFRQDEASRIVLNAHAINQGRLPECSAAGDFRFYELPDAAATADRIVDLCARTLPAETTVDYERAEIGELTLAYAMSVHKSQGSEYPVIVLPLVPGHRIMLQRNLLYTAVTRAKSLVILLGSKAALQTAVENDRTKRRYTLLAERLAQAL